MPHSYGAACRVGPRAAHDSGPRTAKSIRLVVIHSAEAADSLGGDTSAEGVANFFAREATQASTQLAVDRDSCVRMLPDLVIPWGAKGANSDGLHIETCGYAKWSKEEWLERETMLRRSAWKAAKWCWQYAIPARWLSDKQLANGTSKGFTTHAQVNRVFKGGTHWDPGGGYPKAAYMKWVNEYLLGIKAARDR